MLAILFSAKQAAVHTTESGSPSRWARPALSAAGGGSGQRAPRAPTRGPSQVRRQRRLWRPATALPGPCRQRRAALQSTACPATCVSRQWRQQLGGLVTHGEPGPGRAAGQAPASRRSSDLNSKDEEAVAAAALQLRVGCALAALGNAQGDARSMLRSWVRGARSGDGADQRGIATQGEAQRRCAVHH